MNFFAIFSFLLFFSSIWSKIAENQLLQDAPPEGVSDSQQPSNDLELEKGCDRAGAEPMSVTELCALPPHKGTGNDDIFRYYYNPVVQMCLPFSYSGKGGNSNRFVSVKNCYEICHPSDPSVKKPRVVSAIRAYLVPHQKSDCPKPTPITAREYVVRHLPHPLNPAYTLSIVQSVQHVDRPKDMHFGSSSGIGEAIALKFAAFGAHVVLSGKDDQKMSSVAIKCRQMSSTIRVLQFKADLRVEAEARALVAKTIEKFARIDILVTNENSCVFHSVFDPKIIQLFDSSIQTNVRSVLQLISICIPFLETTKGKVVVVSSQASSKPVILSFLCTVAVTTLSPADPLHDDLLLREVRARHDLQVFELAPKGIRVNCVSPALTRTPLLNYGGLEEESAEEVAKKSTQRMRSFAEVEDIANAVVFLSSEKSSFITGTVLPVDGMNVFN
ncbi:unnamed protein product [Medioppia subpectinata]|uniref:BPTI/Kunitz inhibitor domain-containing protein n=1 Tax=Medioppia subpectinata TaxID=1979941 RepID=A0A7R9PYG9_9ACAR|nr:unnamed protein product [Medioppia subpectinata]CAG2106071.1 unnamed protein product [Medioppia subpectinata]